MSDYPWYATVLGDDLEQGDVFRRCPVFAPLSSMVSPQAGGEDRTIELEWVERDVIVMSQSCDMFKGQEKLTEVLLCAVWGCDEVGGHLATRKGKEDARRGNLPAYHMLAACDFLGFESDAIVVDFRRVYALPLADVRMMASRTGRRLRLLPPYREHLAQSFARFFMRVGLPVPIPSF
jgi:hypothetical protein